MRLIKIIFKLIVILLIPDSWLIFILKSAWVYTRWMWTQIFHSVWVLDFFFFNFAFDFIESAFFSFNLNLIISCIEQIIGISFLKVLNYKMIFQRWLFWDDFELHVLRLYLAIAHDINDFCCWLGFSSPIVQDLVKVVAVISLFVPR